jgi:methylmalonyl-CoA/ethylmalonyl-CoA epimerase
MKFDHVGIVVDNIGKGRHFLATTFGIEHWTKVFEDAGIGVYVQFGIGPDGPCYELIAPLNSDSPVSGVLKDGHNILNHVAYLVTDLDFAATALRSFGCFPVTDPQPAIAYQGNSVQFFLSPLRFIVELIEAPEHQHSYVTQSVHDV